MTRFVGLLIVPVAIILAVLWGTAGTAHAATYEETCRRVPMLQGKVGETVEVCELHRVASIVKPARSVARLDRDGTCGGLPAVCCDPQRGNAKTCKLAARQPGVTTVVHYGTRAPVYTIAYIK